MIYDIVLGVSASIVGYCAGYWAGMTQALYEQVKSVIKNKTDQQNS